MQLRRNIERTHTIQGAYTCNSNSWLSLKIMKKCFLPNMGTFSTFAKQNPNQNFQVKYQEKSRFYCKLIPIIWPVSHDKYKSTVLSFLLSNSSVLLTVFDEKTVSLVMATCFNVNYFEGLRHNIYKYNFLVHAQLASAPAGLSITEMEIQHFEAFYPNTAPQRMFCYFRDPNIIKYVNTVFMVNV